MTAVGPGRAGRLSVLLVSAYAAPHIGGVEVVVAQQARTLAGLGYDVTVITSASGPGGNGGDRGARERGARERGAGRERVDGYTVLRVPAWNGLERRWGVPFPVWSPVLAWRLARCVRRSDVVHVHDAYQVSSLLAAAAAWLGGRRLFLTQHVGLVDHDRALVRAAQRAAYATLGRLVWRWAADITVYNPIVAAFLARHGVPAAKVRLVYNGVNTGFFRPADLAGPAAARATRRAHGLPDQAPLILSVGRLVPKKGFAALMEARGPEYELVIAGPGLIPGDVPDGVTFLGPLGHADLRELYQASDIFAAPSVGEMLTLAMQEAMACGLPVVAAGEDGYAGYGLDPRGVTLIPPEPGVLRAEFLSLLGDPVRLRYMQAYSRRLALERFDWEANARDLASEYAAAGPAPGRPGRPRRRGGGRGQARRWALALVAGLALAGSVISPAARHQWALALIRQPDTYTALSFGRAWALPAAASRGQPLPVSFTIVNHEGRALRYRYVLAAIGARRSLVLATAARTIPAGRAWSVSARIRPDCAGSPCRVQVSLPGHPESIDFVVTLRKRRDRCAAARHGHHQLGRRSRAGRPACR